MDKDFENTWTRRMLSEKQASDSSKNWLVNDVFAPAYDALVVEPGNALRQTVNGLLKPIIHKELIEDRLSTSTDGNVQFLGGDWWVQNITSGLASAVTYTVAGKLTGGALRFLQGNVQKQGMKLLTSELGLKCRPVTDLIGKTGNAASRLILNEKVHQVTGAAIYDGIKETREGETHWGNMAGGAASFTVYEAGNVLINRGFGTAQTVGILGRAKTELAKSAWRTVPGALGSWSHILASHAVSGQELPLENQSWFESAVTGGAMNAVLPWVQHGIGKSIDWAAVRAHKSVPFERYNNEIDSPILRELSRRNPEVRVQIEPTILKCEGQLSRISLPKNANEPEQAHELTHVDLKKNFDRNKELKEVSTLIKYGNIEEARKKYFGLRVKEELISRSAEGAVQSGYLEMKVRWNEINEGNPNWKTIANNHVYRKLFNSDFDKLVDNFGRSVAETDLNAWTRLSVAELHRIANLNRADMSDLLSKMTLKEQWIAYQIWDAQNSLANRQPINDVRLSEIENSYDNHPILRHDLHKVQSLIEALPNSIRNKYPLLASELVTSGIAREKDLARYIVLVDQLANRSIHQKSVAELARVNGSENLPIETIQKLCDMSKHLKGVSPRTLERLVGCIKAWEVEHWLPAHIAADIGQLPEWKMVAARLAWSDALAEKGIKIGDSAHVSSIVEKDFWKHFAAWTKGPDRQREVFAEGTKRYGKEFSDIWTEHNLFSSLIRTEGKILQPSTVFALERFFSTYEGDKYQLLKGFDSNSFEEVFANLQKVKIRKASTKGLLEFEPMDSRRPQDVFATLVSDARRRRASENDAVRQALTVSLTFGKQYPQWLSQAERHGLSLRDVSDWLPLAPAAKLQGLASFLIKNETTPLAQLSTIASHWEHLGQTARNLPTERLYRLSAAVTDITQLPKLERLDAWRDAVKTFGRTKQDELCLSLAELPAKFRLPAFAYAVKNLPSWSLIDAVKGMPEKQLPELAKLVLTCSNEKLRSDLLFSLYTRVGHETSVSHVPELTRKMFESVSNCGESDLATIKKWSSLFPENDNSIQGYLSKTLSADYLTRLLFNASDYRTVSKSIAEENPDVIRVIAKGISSYNNTAQVEHAGAILNEWKQTGSLNAAVKKAISLAFLPEYLHDRLVSADVLGELSKSASYAEKQAAANSLLKQIDSPVVSDTGPKIVLSLLSAAQFNKADAGLAREAIFAPLQAMLYDSKRSPDWRLFVFNQIAKLEQLGEIPRGLVSLPDLKMQAKELPNTGKMLLRTSCESGLVNVKDVQALLGRGKLGRLFPEVFGDAEEGGIVGRRCNDTGETIDRTTFRTLEFMSEDPRLSLLSEKDRLNLMWAALFHGTGIHESYSESGYGARAANNCWGPLKSLGYSNVQITRIASLLKNFEKFPSQKDLSVFHRNQDDIALALNRPSAIEQCSILSEAMERARNIEVKDRRATDKMLVDRVRHLNRHSVPLLTSELPKKFGVFPISGQYALLAHTSANLTDGFLRHLPVLESETFSASTSLITRNHHHLYDPNQSIIPILSGPSEQISQLHRDTLSTGNQSDWDWHVQLATDWMDSTKAFRFADALGDKIFGLGLGNRELGNLGALAVLREKLSQFDSIDDLYRQEGTESVLVKAHDMIVRALTTNKKGNPSSTYNEIKINNPSLEGIAVLRRGKQVVLDEANIGLRDSISGSIVIPEELLQILKQRQLPLVILDP